MKREIKFRAWETVIKFMAEVTKIDYPNNVVQLRGSQYGTNFKYVELMQFTGLRDKNGRDIYEGDIVEVDNTPDDEPENLDVTTVCEWDNGMFNLLDLAGGSWARQLFHQPERLTVIGNIHENPELLK